MHRWIIIEEDGNVVGTNSEQAAVAYAKEIEENGINILIDCEQRQQIRGFDGSNFIYQQIPEQTTYVLG